MCRVTIVKPFKRTRAAGRIASAARPMARRSQLRQLRQRERTRNAILKAAFRLYARDGYAAVSMRALANDLGCRAPSIYNYFLSKDEIFEALKRIGFRQYLESIDAPTADAVQDLRN